MSINNRQIKTNGEVSQQAVSLVAKQDVIVSGKEYKAGEQIKCSRSEARRMILQTTDSNGGKVFDIKMD